MIITDKVIRKRNRRVAWKTFKRKFYEGTVVRVKAWILIYIIRLKYVETLEKTIFLENHKIGFEMTMPLERLKRFYQLEYEEFPAGFSIRILTPSDLMKMGKIPKAEERKKVNAQPSAAAAEEQPAAKEVQKPAEDKSDAAQPQEQKQAHPEEVQQAVLAAPKQAEPAKERTRKPAIINEEFESLFD